MREPLKSMLKNLPEGLHFENGSLFAFCDDCDKKIEYEIRQRNIKEGPYYCKNCAPKHKKFSQEAKERIAAGAKKRSGKGICNICNMLKDNRNAAGICPDCLNLAKNAENNKKPGLCSKCSKYNFLRDQNGRGKDIGYGRGKWVAEEDILDLNGKVLIKSGDICGCNCSYNYYKKHNSSKTMINIINERNKIQNGSITCSIHGHQEYSFTGKCILCINEQKDYKSQNALRIQTILENIENGIYNHWPGGVRPNFITKNNVIYYKNELVTNIINKLNSGEYDIKDFPGWNKRFGEWYYKNKNILTGEIDKLNGSNFYVKNSVKYFYDKSIGDYIPWNNYKEKFQKFYYDINFKLPNGFKLYSTFRTQDSINWNGVRIAFEQNLVDNNINWFVYIKFYIDHDNNIKPLVVGKSGSLNVNTNGSDVSFSTDINDGPARKFLNDENLDWCKTQIAICKTESEFEAYEMERNIALEYNLFES